MLPLENELNVLADDVEDFSHLVELALNRLELQRIHRFKCAYALIGELLADGQLLAVVVVGIPDLGVELAVLAAVELDDPPVDGILHFVCHVHDVTCRFLRPDSEVFRNARRYCCISDLLDDCLGLLLICLN